MRKVYDCFPFFNELDLLELRLEEGYDHVDYFVITEANKSFQNRDKPFNLEANWDRYAKYHDKIIYVKIEDMPDGDGNTNHWRRENFQREVIMRGLTNANPDDVICISDCDEMIRPEVFDFFRNDTQHQMWICRQPIFWVKLNYWQAEPRGYNISSMAITMRKLRSPQEIRNQLHPSYSLPEHFDDGQRMIVHHAGWNFTYLGDDNHAKVKLVNFAHDEGSYLAATVDTEAAILKNVNPIAPNDPGRYESIVVDDYFPKTIRNNLDKWNHLIVPNATNDIRNFLPPYEQR